MNALLVIDMQVGSFEERVPRFDADGVVQRINELATVVRETGGVVVFIQHDGPPGDPFAPDAHGWQLLPTLDRRDADLIVHKQTCDAFYETELTTVLQQRGINTLIMSGCATDFCVDTTVRAAASRCFDLFVADDAHTTADRPHLDAPSIIRHHNWVWSDLIVPGRAINVLPTSEVVRRLRSGRRD